VSLCVFSLCVSLRENSFYFFTQRALRVFYAEVAESYLLCFACFCLCVSLRENLLFFSRRGRRGIFNAEDAEGFFAVLCVFLSLRFFA
jgi:hypothetical protein